MIKGYLLVEHKYIINMFYKATNLFPYLLFLQVFFAVFRGIRMPFEFGWRFIACQLISGS